MWTDNTLLKIKELKKKILKKKIMLNFLIDQYGWYDKLYRWGHITVAFVSPFAGFVNLATTNNTSVQIMTVILGCIVTGLIKARDYIAFDKIKETAKQQTVKYTQLFDRIDREVDKPDARKQDESEFNYWIIREYNSIELSDPELSHSDKEKFIALCKLHNIPFDDDLDDLHELMSQTKEQHIVTIKSDNSTTASPITPVTTAPIPEINKIINTITKINEHKSDNVVDNTDIDTDTDNIPQPTLHRVLSINTASSPKSIVRNRLESDERQFKTYKDTLKNLDPTADLKWTMDRFNQLEN